MQIYDTIIGLLLVAILKRQLTDEIIYLVGAVDVNAIQSPLKSLVSFVQGMSHSADDREWAQDYLLAELEHNIARLKEKTP